MRSPPSPVRRKRSARDTDDSSVSILSADSLQGGAEDDDAADRITEQLKEAACTANADDNCPFDVERAAERRSSRSGWDAIGAASPSRSARSYANNVNNNNNNTVEYGTADVDNVSILNEDYLSDQTVIAELATDNFAELLERAAREDGGATSGRTRFYEEAEHARGVKKETYDDDDDDTTVQHGNKKQGLCDMRRGLCASICLSLSALLAFFGSDLFFDEDDVVAVVALAKSAGGAGGGAAAAKIDAMAKLMAVSAAQNATGTVASGKALASAAAGAGGGAAGSAGSSSSATSQTAVVVTAVAVASAVVGGLVVGKDGQSLLCPEVKDPDVLKGTMAMDFLGTDRRLTEDEAGVMGSTLVESYNDIFGCEADYSRLLLNCSIPCEIIELPNNDTATLCCEQFVDPAFGDMMRCPFECFVHCKGCPVSEPLFLTESTNETIPGAGGLRDQTNGTALSNPIGNVRLLQEGTNTTCSPMCMVTARVEDVVCGRFFNDSDNCIVVRSYTVGISNEEEKGSDEGKVEEISFVPPPTAAPTPVRIISSNDEPIILATNLRSSAPRIVPTLSPTVFPTLRPTPSPMWSPSAVPTNDAVVDLILYDDTGRNLGSLDGTTVNVAEVGLRLTVRAEVSRPVRSVDFYFDDEFVTSEGTSPYFLNQDDNVVGFAYSPLAIPGEHNVTAIADDDQESVIGRQTALFIVVNDP